MPLNIADAAIHATSRTTLRVQFPAAEKIEARLDNGVLTVRVPKSERAERRKIEIGS